MSDWDNLVEPIRGALEALISKGDAMADRIEELEALYEAAKHDAQEAEAYAEELEAKLAKAVEALEGVRSFVRDLAPYADQGHTLVPALEKACTTLAELKGPNQ